MISKKDNSYLQLVKKFDLIMVFGTTERGKQECEYVLSTGKVPNCFIVSNRENAGINFSGLPVKAFEEISEENKKNGLVLIARHPSNNEESRELLTRAGFRNVASGVCQSMGANIDNRVHVAMLQNAFGEGISFQIDSRLAEENSNIQIYAVTSHSNLHRTKERWNSKYIRYIQAGAALTDEKICDITDNVGDNISEKNPYYNETTAGYWIAKNDESHDYVGLYHYSRGLGLSDAQISAIARSNIDVVLPLPGIMEYEMLSFSGDGVIEPIKRVCPDYLKAAEEHLNDKIFVAGNILIARKSIFKDFYDWLYPIQLEMERAGIHKRSKRAIAWNSETLTNIFFRKNAEKYHIAFYEPKIFEWV